VTSRLDLELDEATSRRLSKQLQHGTKAELIVRRIAHGLGLRFRVHNRDLPGSPDLANRSRHWAIFVHGCYWHSHRGCERATLPKRNREFWKAKFEANRARDARAIKRLRAEGFRVMTVWECELKRPKSVIKRLMGLLSADTTGSTHASPLRGK
jgi:DNA mismatch endonuclease, patch repair protein